MEFFVFNQRYSDVSKRLDVSGGDLWQVHNEASSRLSNGEDIILMSVGDPDLPTIERIIEHAVTSLYRGRTHYSPGMGELHLRETIAVTSLLFGAVCELQATQRA